MALIRICIVLFCCIVLSSCHIAKYKASPGRVLICYWGSWSHYRPGEGRFSVDNVDPNLCTHLVYAFAKLENGVIAPFDPWLDLQTGGRHGMYKKFNDLKRVNPDLKTIIAIGGWNDGSTKYSKMAATEQGRRDFTQSVVNFLGRHGFDGLDLNWAYPTTRGGSPNDKDNFVLLLRTLKAALKPKNYLLMAAVSAMPSLIDSAYNVKELSKNLDFMSIMAYDYFGSWDKTAGHHSPLGSRKHAGDSLHIGVISSVNYWISEGADKSKLVLGLPLYGRSFTLENSNDAGIGAPTTGPGPAGPFTGEAGFIGYNEVCRKVQTSSGWKVTRDPEVGAPVAVRDTEWIGFDDPNSLMDKVRVAVSQNLAGVMVYSIDTDDFKGVCKEGANPLLNAIGTQLGQIPYVRPSLSTPVKPTRPPLPRPTLRPITTRQTPNEGSFHCDSAGLKAHPTDQRKFYACTALRGGLWRETLFHCPARTVFDARLRVCVHDSVPPRAVYR